MHRIDFIRALGLTGLGMAGLGMGIPVMGRGMINQNENILPPLLVDSEGKSIETPEQWKLQRELIKKRWLGYLGPVNPNPETPKLIVLKQEKQDGLIRRYVEYEGEPGIMVRGYLLTPEALHEPLPGIVALHSTSDNQMLYISGAQKGEIVPFGSKLARQGFIVFCPQCFLWHEKGELTYEQVTLLHMQRHPGSRGMAKMLFDAQRAVDVLESLAEVDSSRIGTMGHSLGAKEALYLGAFDDRIKVIVSNEGGIGIEMSNWDDIWYLGEEIHAFGHKHHEVLALAAPKPFLLIGGDSADGELSRPYTEAVQPVYDLYNKPRNLKLENHGQGHQAVPIAEQWTYQWMNKHLKG